MPIPIPAAQPARRLLRNVAYDRLLAAILDGTLEPGERLSDDELAAWLGMSRTPIREAISQLASINLVEMEPNRYTRVAERSTSALAESARFLNHLHELALTWATPLLDDSARRRFASIGANLVAQVRDHDGGVSERLLRTYGEIAAHTANQPFIHTESALRHRVQFLAVNGPHDWDALAASAEALRRTMTPTTPTWMTTPLDLPHLIPTPGTVSTLVES